MRSAAFIRPGVVEWRQAPDPQLEGLCEALVLETAFHAAAPGGMVASVAPTADGAPQLDTAALYHRGVTWTIGRPDCRTGRDGALQLWATAGFRADVVPAFLIPRDAAPSGWASDELYVVAARDGVC